MNAEEYRRAVGMDMIEAEREEHARHPARAVTVKPDARKRDDERCQGVDGELLKGIVLGCESEGGEVD